MKQAELAERAGISQPTLVGLENDRENMTFRSERKVIEALNGLGIQLVETKHVVGVHLKRGKK